MSYSVLKTNDSYSIGPAVEVLVDDADSLPDAALLKLAPGSLAYTADLANVWQLDLTRTWVSVITADEGDAHG